MKPHLSKRQKKDLIKGCILIVGLFTFIYFAHTVNKLKIALTESELNINKLNNAYQDLQNEKVNGDKNYELLLKSSGKLSTELTELQRQKQEATEKLSQLNRIRVANKLNETKLKEYTALNAKYLEKLSLLSQTIETMQAQYDEQMSMIASLESKNRELESQNSMITALMLNNTKVQAMAGRKNRLTVSARRSRTLALGFDLPAAMASDIQFRVITPSGEIIEGDDKRVSINMEPENETLTASIMLNAGNLEITKRVEIIYTPGGRMKPGLYKIDVLHKGLYLGTCQLALR